MIFIAAAILLGLGLGFLSFYHQNLFLAGVLGLGIVAGILLRPFVFLAPMVASEVSPTGTSQGFFKDVFNASAAIFDLVPSSAQTAIFLLPILIILGRLVTWFHYTAFAASALPRTEAERRLHTMQKFSLKRPLP